MIAAIAQCQGNCLFSMSRRFEVEAKVFECLPNLTICIAILRNISFDHGKIERCQQLLEESWKNVPTLLAGYPNVQSHPNIALWRKAYAALKVDKKYSASIENLAKRASKPDSLPRHINPLVDLYNSLSLKHMSPFGGFDLDNSGVCEEMVLRYSRPEDQFLALDNKDGIPEAIPAGEVCYAFKNTIITRHINWRQSIQGLIQSDSKNIILLTELLDPLLFEPIAADIETTISDILGIKVTIAKVDKNNPCFYYD